MSGPIAAIADLALAAVSRTRSALARDFALTWPLDVDERFDRRWDLAPARIRSRASARRSSGAGASGASRTIIAAGGNRAALMRLREVNDWHLTDLDDDT